MNNFGFKVIDVKKFDKEIFEIIEYSNNNKLPIELAIYKEDKEMYERIIKEGKYLNTIHLSRKCNVHLKNKTFEEHKGNIFNEIERGVSYGIYRFVLHMNIEKFNMKKNERKDIIKVLLERLSEINEFSKKMDKNDKKVEIFIENLFEPLYFYKELFEEINELELDRINFCFDIGHAKIWSKDTLENWLLFLKIMKNDYKKNFHFHIHFNAGLKDQHLSFEESINEGITEKDEYFSKLKNISDIIKYDLIDVYKDDTFVMEQNPKYQISGYEIMKKKVINE